MEYCTIVGSCGHQNHPKLCHVLCNSLLQLLPQHSPHRTPPFLSILYLSWPKINALLERMSSDDNQPLSSIKVSCVKADNYCQVNVANANIRCGWFSQMEFLKQNIDICTLGCFSLRDSHTRYRKLQ